MIESIEKTKEILILNGHYSPQDSVKIFDLPNFLKDEVVHSDSELPLYSCKISAGFPSPADDHIEGKLDLNTHLIKHPSATFFVKATGDSMIGAGIHEGDILVVDRSLEPRNGKIIIAAVDGSLTVKRLVKKGKNAMLSPENSKYKPIKLTENNDIIIWGVVTNVIHKV